MAVELQNFASSRNCVEMHAERGSLLMLLLEFISGKMVTLIRLPDAHFARKVHLGMWH